MEPTFWIESWERGGTCTSFHRRDFHPYVIKYATPEFLYGKRVLVPLSGKTNDLLWFREYAEHVTGVELVEKAIHQFFEDQELNYTQTEPQRYESENLTMLNMNIFDVTRELLGRTDFVYDRAALVALPYAMRMHYIEHLNNLLDIGSQQLVITLDYEPHMDTPPFSINPGEVTDYYQSLYQIEHVEALSLPEHRMVEKFNLDFLKEHGFLLKKTN